MRLRTRIERLEAATRSQVPVYEAEGWEDLAPVLAILYGTELAGPVWVRSGTVERLEGLMAVIYPEAERDEHQAAC